MIENYEIEFLDLEPKTTAILKEVLAGLSKSQKSLPPKLLYDKRGSEIFEKICQLKEYYPTRSENQILKSHAQEMAQLIGPQALLIEPGSGAGEKIRYLLPHLKQPQGYVPIEISKEILLRMTSELHEEFAGLKIIPVCADFTDNLELPLSVEAIPGKKVVFFPGSTIGNMNPQESINFLRHYGKMIGHGGGFLIGVDLKKDPEILKQAYDDALGVTAAFNLNLLTRLNREADASFDPGNFSHEAIYNEKQGRIEMHLVSKIPQLVKVHETVFRFHEGESIHTESSYKYTPDEFCELAARAKFQIKKLWKDKNNFFCVYYFERE